MKEKVVSGIINVVVLAIVLLIGMGGYSLWNVIQFQKAYQANILSVQKQNIEATCKALVEVEQDASKE